MIDKNDPGFRAYVLETVPLELRNWRNWPRIWNDYQRYIKALKWVW